ncbi:biotin/lipoate a/B protein ligase family protein [Hirsutella rhossiliensis]|uniref:lipoyl(octanoyl) transferase n=1 Tax=Hirsutella rhossiliensis TaxID=111463 RepID=A0A9P8MX70_9HYPO|nr:biotin/lipoate a/B protein ligase family domain-containing protein [Hirsutella rhossiliensis]KAH0963953.1 biotin/lipoate a/B protein ligase family domain-containing protein [Hirsutella rhossiliensis]
MRLVASLRPRPVASSLRARVKACSSLPSPAPLHGAADTNVLSGCQRRGLSLLQHRHLGEPAGQPAGPAGIVSYDMAHEIQEQHRSLFLAWKALPDSPRRESEGPRPLLVSFESTPTFTIGRRQHDLTTDQAARLGQKLDVRLTHRREPVLQSYYPDVTRTNRGGLTTYHGPGQLVLWPVIDMHSHLHARYGVASYASHLEATTQRLLAELFGIQTSTVRDEPGVWVGASGRRPRKIAALGVHHRRHVTSLGIAVNVDVAVTGGEEVNPWSRFVPCGLQDKAVTSIAAEMEHAPTEPWDMVKLAERWASIFEEGLLNGKRGGVGKEADARLQP